MKRINFNEFYPVLFEMALEKGLTRAEFMRACGLPKQRHTDFLRGKLNFTGRYFNKCLEGLRMKIKDVEERAGRKLTEDQKRELKRLAWVDKNMDIIDILSNDPKLARMIRASKNTK